MKYDFNRVLAKTLTEHLEAIRNAKAIFVDPSRVENEYPQACEQLDKAEVHAMAMLSTATADQELTHERIQQEVVWLLGNAIREKTATPQQMLECLAMSLVAITEMFELPLKTALDEVEKQFGAAAGGQVKEAVAKAARGEGSNN